MSERPPEPEIAQLREAASELMDATEAVKREMDEAGQRGELRTNSQAPSWPRYEKARQAWNEWPVMLAAGVAERRDPTEAEREESRDEARKAEKHRGPRPLPERRDPPADPRALRCLTTGNPCGTDTWAVGCPCACPSCQKWLSWFEALRAGGPAREEVDVVAAVRRDSQGRYWLCRRDGNGAHGGLAGMWEYPGGKVEPGEQLREALARELHEEFGVTDVRLGAVLDSIVYQQYRVTFFDVTMEDPVELRNHTEARWMTAHEVCCVEHLPSGTIFNARHLAGPAREERRIRSEVLNEVRVRWFNESAVGFAAYIDHECDKAMRALSSGLPAPEEDFKK